MFTVQFSPCRVVEYTDAQKFEQRVVKWMLLREAENSYILGHLREIYASMGNPAGVRARLFALEDDGAVIGAAVTTVDGGIIVSWMSQPMMRRLADHLQEAGCLVSYVYAPAHVSWRFAQEWAQRTGQRWEMGMEERVYQLIRVRNPRPPGGQMQLALPPQRALLLKWMERFIEEAHFPDPRAGFFVDMLLAQKRLFTWSDGEAVSMASWVMPTPRGGCISFVYTPREFRKRGYAKALVAALGSHMLASGLECCFIFTDTTDQQTNSLYQAIGARTLCEFVRCTLSPVVRPGAPLAQAALAGAPAHCA